MVKYKVRTLWDKYWKHFDDVGRASTGGRNESYARQSRFEFASSHLYEFRLLERDIEKSNEDIDTLALFHQLGCCLYGDIDDSASYLKHLRSQLRNLPDGFKHALDPIDAIVLTLYASGKSQTEFASTLSLIGADCWGPRKSNLIRRALVAAVESICTDRNASINVDLFLELSRFFVLDIELQDAYTFRMFFEAVKSLPGLDRPLKWWPKL